MASIHPLEMYLIGLESVVYQLYTTVTNEFCSLQRKPGVHSISAVLAFGRTCLALS